MVTFRGMAKHRFSNVYFGENHTPPMGNGMAAIPKFYYVLKKRVYTSLWMKQLGNQ